MSEVFYREKINLHKDIAIVKSIRRTTFEYEQVTDALCKYNFDHRPLRMSSITTGCDSYESYNSF